jgi:hypothetical protein
VLVDVLLALLARPAAPLPAAPLREAVEALFRATCSELTPAGLQDLVRVVGRSSEQGGSAGEALRWECGAGAGGWGLGCGAGEKVGGAVAFVEV